MIRIIKICITVLGSTAFTFFSICQSLVTLLQNENLHGSIVYDNSSIVAK